MSSSRAIFFGGGTMGSALAEQMVREGVVRRSDVAIVERDASRLQVLRKNKFHAVADPESIAFKNADVVVLAVKPQDAAVLLRSLQGKLAKTTLVISIMAGMSLSSLQRLLNHDRVVRSMPNLAATVGLGMTAWFPSSACSTADRALAQNIFCAFGTELRVASDDAIDRLTAVSGSGPGYLFAVARDLVAAVRALGLQKNEAEQLIKQTLVGATALYEQSDLSAEELYQRVASKGGTTEAANNVLRHGHSAQLWKKALNAAYQRARAISRSLDKASRLR